jgi:hypothetical protein
MYRDLHIDMISMKINHIEQSIDVFQAKTKFEINGMNCSNDIK